MKNTAILLSITASLLLLVNCNSTPKPVATVQSFAMLDSASVYDTDSIRNFEPTSDAVVEAKKLYLKGIDVAVNNSKPAESLTYFLKSLRIAPDQYTYLAYADALFESESYELAKQTYTVAMYAYNGAEIDGPAEYGSAKCEAMQGNIEDAINDLRNALSTFPFSKETVEEERAFDNLRETEQYKLAMAEVFSNEQELKQRLLTIFDAGFAKYNLPYSIGVDSLPVSEGQSIDYRYASLVEELGEGEFSRDVSRDFQYVASLPLSPNYKSYVYRAVDMISENYNPVEYTLVNIDTLGNILSQQVIACSCSPLTLKAVTIAADGVIEVKEIAQTWKEDPLYKGYEGNQVEKQEVKGVTYYKAEANGEIVELEQRDASSTADNNTSANTNSN